jgi:hypothetical protein
MILLRRLLCTLGFHVLYECEPECCGQTLCVWCGKVEVMDAEYEAWEARSHVR